MSRERWRVLRPVEISGVLVIGEGNAVLCAAIEAREAGTSVLLVAHAPRAFRGGNSRHTRNLRAMFYSSQIFIEIAY